ncbi:hypothetical protein HK096_005834 [Nowakowskiella sp. JEL0078]|nr:hypothetical protein HK096_005834 [Nowakowskiella sp. JEL0078]
MPSISSRSLEFSQNQTSFSSLLSRSRNCLYAKNPLNVASSKPVPLVKISKVSSQTFSSVRYIATGINPEAEIILARLPAPLFIVAFTGFGRTGKSFTASYIRKQLSGGSSDVEFVSAPGNVPCTHGIDMMVFPHPDGFGSMVFLDCEGGANHNSTAIPFVIGLAARLSSRIYVFERGCFTTGGLDTVMQVVNMGHATSANEVDISRSLVLVENMTINEEIPEEKLLHDLLSETSGDETTNRIRGLIRQRFDIEFAKLPYRSKYASEAFEEACIAIAGSMLQHLTPFTIANVPADGTTVIQLVTELLQQIRNGGSRYNMVSATEALVANMAMEAATTVWLDFVDHVKKIGNHPSQITSRKPLKVILREIEGVANGCINELEAFINKLAPNEPAIIAKNTWERNYKAFENEIRSAYKKKEDEMKTLSVWAQRLNMLVIEIASYVVEAVRQLVRFARFSTIVVLMSNYYLWKNCVTVVSGMAESVLMPN